MRAAGAIFEERACAELQRAGLKLLSRNYTTRYGEIDLIMLDGDTIVFVEVRHRLTHHHGSAATTVTATKQAKLIQTAELWLSSQPRHANRPCRFDVVSYDGPADRAAMAWWRRAFEAS